jgi:hypothetical protein
VRKASRTPNGGGKTTTRLEVLEALHTMSTAEQLEWLARLGWRLSVCARSGYPDGDNPGNLTYMIGCNELQRQIYNRMNALRVGHERPLDELLDTLLQKASVYRIDGDFRWALFVSLRPPGGPDTSPQSSSLAS